MGIEIVAIILNWNGLDIKYSNEPILKLTIESFKKTTNNIRLIVADAESKDGSVEYLHKNNIDVLKVKNNGWAYANNKAIKYAFKKYPNLDYILLLNDDLIFKDAHWINKLIKASKLKDIGIVGCKLLNTNGTIQQNRTYVNFFGISSSYKDSLNGVTYFVIGAVFLVKKEVFKKIGLFDEIYLPFFAEDTDFCNRASRAGFYSYYVGDTNITHLESQSIKKTNIKTKWNKEQITYSSIRNTFIIALRYYKYKLPLVVFWLTLQSFFWLGTIKNKK